MTESLVDRIYEAAFVPDLWPGVLASLADGAGAAGGVVIIQDNGRVSSRQTPGLDAVMSEVCVGGAWERVKMAAYMRKAPPSTFVHGPDYFPEDVMHADALAHQCSARGMGKVITTLIEMPTAEAAFVTLERSQDADRPDDRAMSWLNGLRPHLARAAMIAARLQLEQARNTVETLSRLGLPAAVLTAGGAVMAANERFEALKEPFRIGTFDRLSLTHSAANALFRDAVAGAGARAPVVKSIPLPARDDAPSMIVHVAPIARSAQDIFNRAACIVIATPLGVVDVPDGAMLNGLFDLTPAEARLVQRLARGMTINQVAEDLTLSVATLRTQLSSVFAKTGARRQTELVRLIGSMGALAPSP